jgi:4-amino-4-deoxy-L-arabinose transferase-like glycosyltransferase
VALSKVRSVVGRLRRALSKGLGTRRPSRRAVLLVSAGLWLLGFVVRSWYAVDLAPVMYSHEQPGTRMASRYDDAALAHLAGDGILYPRVWPDRSDTALVSRPPGYPLFIALVYRTIGRSGFAVQLVQNALGSLLPVFLFLLATGLFGLHVGGLAGAMAACSAPLARYCAVLTPDSLGTLLAVAVMALVWRDRWRPGWTTLAACVLLGAATWLRPNFLLMAVFVSVGLLAASPRRRRAAPWVLGAAVIAILLVMPVTIRNWRIYGAFVPVSINMGILVWEGIADAGGEHWGARGRDAAVAIEEAKYFRDPRYAGWWASPDGILRDRERMRRSLEVIRAEPLWFLAAAVRRVGEMLDYGDGGVPSVRGADDAPPSEPHLTPAETAMLAPGRLGAWARRPIALVQGALAAVTLPLVVAGLGVCALLSPRRLLLVLLVPLYHLLTQAPLHYEPRYVLPMHALSLIVAAAAVAALAAVVSTVARSGRSRR